TGPSVPDARDVRRRRLALATPLVPIAIALLYAAVYGFLRHRPSLAAMVPPDPILVWHYRDLSAYDTAHAAPVVEGQPPVAAASAVVGAEINLPTLPGIARDRSVLEILLDPALRWDPKYFVLPVADAGKVESTFRDPDLAERHARHVKVHGDWAAAG